MDLEERALIGGVMLSRAEDLPAVVYDIEPGHFEDPALGTIWTIMRVQLDQGVDPDEMTVATMAGQDRIRALATEIASDCATTANLGWWARKVYMAGEERATRHKLEVALEAARKNGSVDGLRAAIHESEVLQSRGTSTLRHVSEDIDAVRQEIAERRRDPDRFRLCRTGILELDSIVEMEPAQLTIIAARPGIGKSALMCNISDHSSLSVATLIFSMEMSRFALIKRMLHTSDLAGRKLFIDDRARLTVEQIRSTALMVPGPMLVVVDYLQLANTTEKYERNDLRVGAITKGLKSLAKDIPAHVIALCQLNRKVEDRADKRPVLSDLRDSGAIEEDADSVWLLHRPGYYDPSAGSGADIIVAKNRHGPTGYAPVIWNGSKSRFENP